MNLRLRENALDLLLLTGMLLSVATSFTAVHWTWGLDVLIWTTVGGLVAGFLLARSAFSPRLAHTFSLAYGVIGTAMAVSTRLPDWLSLRWKVMEMALRIWRWTEIAWRGRERSADALVFVLELAFLCWWIAYIAAWFAFRRRQAWGILIPTGLLFFWNLYYSSLPLNGHRFVYLLCALLLVPHVTLRRRQQRWRLEAVSFSSSMGGNVVRYGVVFALCIMTLAWLIPPLTGPQAGALIEWLPAERMSVKLQQEWQRLFSALEVPFRGTGEPFGLELRLPDPIRTRKGVVLTVQAPLRRYYWRAVAYDRYTGQGWQDSDTQLALLDPLATLGTLPEYAMRQEITQTITTRLPGTTILFAASQPLRMSLPAKVTYSSVEEISPSLWQSHRRLSSEESYTAVSSVSIASEENLRGAGTDYPSWVRARYLQLPNDLPTRVISLAHSLTDQVAGSYDQVSAIERYLRTIPYNEQVGPPPAGSDVVDYFLFEHREGYCTHYASALVVMSRALGIPARLAAGYSSGEYDADEGLYVVSRANGHAWAEVFFPEHGWVEFEPTASESLVVRPRPVVVEGEPVQPPPDEAGLGDESADLGGYPGDEYGRPDTGGGIILPRTGNWRRLAWALGIVAVLCCVAAAGWGASRWWIGRRFTPAAWAYTRLIAFGRWLRCPLSAGQTPHQYAQTLTAVVPEGQALVRHLVGLYVAERFGQHLMADEEAERAWRDLRPILLRRWVLQRWMGSPLRGALIAVRRVFGGINQ